MRISLNRYCWLSLIVGLVGVSGRNLVGQVPRWTTKFQVDPFWPKILPNDWIWGPIGGVCIDSKDHVWVVERTAASKKKRPLGGETSMGHLSFNTTPRATTLAPLEIRRWFQPVFTAASLIATAIFLYQARMMPWSRSIPQTASYSCRLARN